LNFPDDVFLFDIYGRLLLKRYDADRVEVGDLAPGMYLLKTSKGVIRKVLIQ